MGYIEYLDSKALKEKASKEDSSVTVDPTKENEKTLQKVHF